MEWWKILLGLLCLFAAFCYQAYQSLSKNLPKPTFDSTEYWGKGKVDGYKEDSSIRSFKVDYSDKVISKLSARLEDANEYTEPLEGVNFEYGFNSNHLKKIVSYWKDTYLPKWNERQQFLNQFSHFKTQIQGLNIHFMHIKPTKINKDTKVFPLLLIHGWPGSIREFYEIIPLLTTANKDNISFEVVAPSLPGFGFSDGASKRGMGPEKMAVVMRNLMVRLELPKFFIQAGDWGSIVGSSLSALYPENVLGYHTNFIGLRTPWAILKTAFASFYPSYFIEDEKYISWMYPFSKEFFFLLQETGYFHLQATKPDTIGIALCNNPIGLAAYILEKFSTATNRDYRKLPDGGLEKYFTLDQLIDNLMIYYLSNSAVTAARIYKESISKLYTKESKHNLERVAVEVPTGAAHFRHEAQHQFAFLTSERFKKIIQSSYFEDGGHFAALQLPKILHEDFVSFVKKTL